MYTFVIPYTPMNEVGDTAAAEPTLITTPFFLNWDNIVFNDHANYKILTIKATTLAFNMLPTRPIPREEIFSVQTSQAANKISMIVCFVRYLACIF